LKTLLLIKKPQISHSILIIKILKTENNELFGISEFMDPVHRPEF
jgi:hypothetical protein